MNSFEVPLKEFVRAVKSAKSVITDRSTALGLLQQVPMLLQCLHMLHSALFTCTGISVVVSHAGVVSQRHICKARCQPETPAMHCLLCQGDMLLLQARADVDAKRTKLAKLRGTAGIKVTLSNSRWASMRNATLSCIIVFHCYRKKR